jgi:hypothetical protein
MGYSEVLVTVPHPPSLPPFHYVAVTTVPLLLGTRLILLTLNPEARFKITAYRSVRAEERLIQV